MLLLEVQRDPASHPKTSGLSLEHEGPSTNRVSRRLQLLCLGLNPSLDPLPNTAIGAILAELFESLNLRAASFAGFCNEHTIWYCFLSLAGARFSHRGFPCGALYVV